MSSCTIVKTFLFNLSIVVIRVRSKLLIETNIRKELSFAVAHDIQSHVAYCTYDVYIVCLYINLHKEKIYVLDMF